MRSRNRGSALLTALFIMVLISITATAIIHHLSIDIAQTDRFIKSDRLYLAAQFIPFWAMEQLKASETKLIATNAAGRVLTLPSQWKNSYPSLQISGEIYDAQARFNLNSMNQPQGESSLIKLIQLTQTKKETNNLIKMIATATKAWISPQTSYQQDQWNQYYSSLPHPYQAAHQLMRSPSEFLLISGVTPKLYQALSPYITTLPEIMPVNLNTASAPVIQAVNPELTEEQVNEFIKLRDQEPILTQKSFSQLLQKFHFTAGANTFQSHYFLSIAKAQQNNHTFILYTLLKRTQQTSKIWKVQIIRESSRYF
jgi:general secretion pathway protein K